MLFILFCCDLFSLVFCCLVLLFEFLLLFKFWGGIGGLEEFIGLNVMLCLEYVLILGDVFGMIFCWDFVLFCFVDDSWISWVIEWLECIVMWGWFRSGGCIVIIWLGVWMFLLDLKKRLVLYFFKCIIFLMDLYIYL